MDDEFDQQLAAQIEDHAQREIHKDQTDPRQQMYMKNATTGRLIKSKAMHDRAIEGRQGIEYITYNQALELLKEEKAARHRALNAKKAKKRVRAARKNGR